MGFFSTLYIWYSQESNFLLHEKLFSELVYYTLNRKHAAHHDFTTLVDVCQNFLYSFSYAVGTYYTIFTTKFFRLPRPVLPVSHFLLFPRSINSPFFPPSVSWFLYLVDRKLTKFLKAGFSSLIINPVKWWKSFFSILCKSQNSVAQRSNLFLAMFCRWTWSRFMIYNSLTLRQPVFQEKFLSVKRSLRWIFSALEQF